MEWGRPDERLEERRFAQMTLPLADRLSPSDGRERTAPVPAIGGSALYVSADSNTDRENATV